MIDYYIYFDRVNGTLKVYKEDCYLRSKELLMKRERILEEEDVERAYINTKLDQQAAIGCFILFFVGFGIILFNGKRKNLN